MSISTVATLADACQTECAAHEDLVAAQAEAEEVSGRVVAAGKATADARSRLAAALQRQSAALERSVEEFDRAGGDVAEARAAWKEALGAEEKAGQGEKDCNARVASARDAYAATLARRQELIAALGGGQSAGQERVAGKKRARAEQHDEDEGAEEPEQDKETLESMLREVNGVVDAAQALVAQQKRRIASLEMELGKMAQAHHGLSRRCEAVKMSVDTGAPEFVSTLLEPTGDSLSLPALGLDVGSIQWDFAVKE